MIDHLLRLRRRKSAYQRLFAYERGDFIGDAKAVIGDLARFCRINEPPIMRDGSGATDPLQTGILVGRQEVFNRIRAMVHVDDARLFNLKEDDE